MCKCKIPPRWYHDSALTSTRHTVWIISYFCNTDSKFDPAEDNALEVNKKKKLDFRTESQRETEFNWFEPKFLNGRTTQNKRSNLFSFATSEIFPLSLSLTDTFPFSPSLSQSFSGDWAVFLIKTQFLSHCSSLVKVNSCDSEAKQLANKQMKKQTNTPKGNSVRCYSKAGEGPTL